MIVRKRILLLASLLLLVSVGGIVNLMWQMPRIEQIQDPKAILQVLIFLGLFGAGLAFAILELVRQEIRNPIIQFATQISRLKEPKINGQRLELTGNRDIDLLSRALNDLLDGFVKEENLSHAFTETSPDMIFLLDQEGCVLFGNTNAARQWNYQPGEIIGKRQEELFPPDIAARHKQVIKKIFATGQPFSTDVHEMIGKRQRWIDARMLPVLDRDGQVTAVLGMSRDITERKQANEELHLQRQELFHMQRFKSMGELASSLAHELNQPLAGILINAQAAQRFLAGTEPDLGQIREILADIVADDKRAGEVIHRLRTLLRKDESIHESMDINSTVRNMAALVHDEAIARNVSLHLELAEGLPQADADKVQIEQVILNLIMNAVQAMEEIAAHKRNIVVSTVRGAPGGVVVSVRDTGPGIAKDKLEQVFEPFYTTKAQGLGLGLPICRSIVEAHGGRIWAENNPDGGARFCFSLPGMEEKRGEGRGAGGRTGGSDESEIAG